MNEVAKFSRVKVAYDAEMIYKIYELVAFYDIVRYLNPFKLLELPTHDPTPRGPYVSFAE